MGSCVKKFFKSRRGINTVEFVIILAVVVGLAIIFRGRIGAFANSIMDSVFKTDVNDLTPGGMSGYTSTPAP